MFETRAARPYSAHSCLSPPAPAELAGDDSTISFHLPAGLGGEDLPAAVRDAARIDGRAVSLRAADPVPVLRELTAWADGAPGRGLAQLEVRRPSLEDHYLALVNADSNGGAGS